MAVTNSSVYIAYGMDGISSLIYSARTTLARTFNRSCDGSFWQLSVSLLTVVCLGACSDSNESSLQSFNAPVASQVIPNEVLSNPINASEAILDSNTLTQTSDNNPAQAPDTDNSNLSGSDGLAEDEIELAARLETAFALEGQRLIPTTGWICEDVFEQNRIYYFYPEGVLASGRKVVVERTLIANDDFEDLRFFWSASSNDSLLMTSAIMDDEGNMLSTGQQYDVTSIRFTNVDSVASFTAQSLLRGKLVCATFNLQ